MLQGNAAVLHRQADFSQRLIPPRSVAEWLLHPTENKRVDISVVTRSKRGVVLKMKEADVRPERQTGAGQRGEGRRGGGRLTKRMSCVFGSVTILPLLLSIVAFTVADMGAII